MKALVIYDSAYGNTAQIAQAIADTLGCEAHRATEVQPAQLTGLDVLVVGSPTQAFQPLKPVKTLLKRLPAGQLNGVQVAAFDTRIALEDVDSRILPVFVKVFGYAAKPIARRLTQKGGELVLPPEGFFVKGTEGPLRDGELARAASWAERLAPTA
jgi:flavodoxin